MSAQNRQALEPDIVVVHRSHEALFVRAIDSLQDALDQGSQLRPLQSLDTNSNHGRPRGTGNCEQGVEVRVERDKNACLTPGSSRIFSSVAWAMPHSPTCCASNPCARNSSAADLASP